MVPSEAAVPEAAPGSVASRRCRRWGTASVCWCGPCAAALAGTATPSDRVFPARCLDSCCWDSHFVLDHRASLGSHGTRLGARPACRTHGGRALLTAAAHCRSPAPPLQELLWSARDRNVSYRAGVCGFTLGFSWCRRADMMLADGPVSRPALGWLPSSFSLGQRLPLCSCPCSPVTSQLWLMTSRW